MMTVKEVASLTGVSVRTLQFYDEIGLLKPTRLTGAGYRLYDEHALETLQQILFFKELDFTLKEISAIMAAPQFDQAAAFKKQRELIQIKRDRLNALLGLLDKLIKGEKCMDFKDFDMSDYFRMLTDFKNTHTENIVERLGSLEHFDEMVSELQSREDEIADMAEKAYGGLEQYTGAMKKSLQNYLEHGSGISQTEAGGLIEQTEEITKRLTADLNRNVSSPEVQETVRELVTFCEECSRGVDMGKNTWATLAENYLSNPVYVKVNDQKYGEGASKFIGLALQAYLDKK